MLIVTAVLAVSCKKVENSMQGINPEFISRQFFETWKRKDWKALYRMTHPAFIQKLRLQNQSPADRMLDDEALFVREFTTDPGIASRQGASDRTRSSRYRHTIPGTRRYGWTRW